jgi:sterol desaturase/sphingolipid hydroxylase (fatty acid hydroxylase superfamily)
MPKSPVFYAIPAFLLFMALEALYSYFKHKKLYRLNDTITNISLGIGSQISGALSKGLIFGIYIYIQQHYAFFKLPVTWWSFFLCLLLFDFLFYWAHRISHVSNFFWGAHVVHHQSEEYNLSVALRQSWIHNLIAFFIFLPIPFLGFDPITFGIAAGLDTVYQFWIHTRIIGRLHPLIEYIFNTPSHHRVHHAVNPKYLDKNYAGVFIFWDRLFGSFVQEQDQNEIAYGITTQFKSWNPVWANWHYYQDMWEKGTRMTTWRDKLKMIFAKPGWLPDYLGGFQSPPDVNPDTYVKYDADTDNLFKIYGTFQFIFTLAGTIAYLDHFSTITTFYRFLFAAVLIISIMIIGAIFEKRKWIVSAEIVRLVLVLISLNSYYYYWYKHWLTIMEVTSAILFVASIVWLIVSMYKSDERQLA